MLNNSYSSILKTSLPLMLSGFVHSIVLIINASFLSRYNNIDFDAVGNASLIIMVLSMALIGLSEGGQILMSHNMTDEKKTNLIFGASLTLNFIMGLVIFFILFILIPFFLKGYSSHEELLNSELDFISIRSYSFLFTFLSITIQSYFYSIGKISVVMISTIVMALSNISLDYLLIFGNLGFPELGITGAGLATNIAEINALIVLCFFFYKQKKPSSPASFLNKNSFAHARQILKTGLPIMFQGMLSIFAWTLLFLWIEKRGEFELTVSQNIRAIYFIAFVPIWGFSITTKIYVAQFYGLKKFDSIRSVIRKIQILSFISLLVLFHGAILYPKILVSWVNPSLIYLDKSADILMVVAISILLHSILNVYFQSIIGFGKTQVSLLIEVISTIIHLCFSYLLLNVFDMDLFYVWFVELVYFSSLGIMAYMYIYYKNLFRAIVSTNQ